MPCVRLGDKTRLHLFPTTAGPLLNRRATRKRIKATNRVANPSLGIKTRAIVLVLQEVTAAILMLHGTSSTPNVMDGLRMKLTDSLQNINYAEYPTGFNPVNMQNLKKYDGK